MDKEEIKKIVGEVMNEEEMKPFFNKNIGELLELMKPLMATYSLHINAMFEGKRSDFSYVMEGIKKADNMMMGQGFKENLTLLFGLYLNFFILYKLGEKKGLYKHKLVW